MVFSTIQNAVAAGYSASQFIRTPLKWKELKGPGAVVMRN